MNSSKNCVINVGKGFWYPKGSKRLEKSLEDKFYGDILTWNNYPNTNFTGHDKHCVKASAFECILQENYDIVIWMDSSVYAIRNIQPILDWIHTNGMYMPVNGFNVCQETNDFCLNYFNVSRDESEKMTQCSSMVMGFDMNDERCKNFINEFIKSGKDGAFDERDTNSKDERCLRHRHDQSVASILTYKYGLLDGLDRHNIYTDYLCGKDKNDKICLINHGM